MDLNSITQLISSVGFPIACTCALFYFWNRDSERHREEMNEIKDALANNTLALQHLVDTLKGGDE